MNGSTLLRVAAFQIGGGGRLRLDTFIRANKITKGSRVFKRGVLGRLVGWSVGRLVGRSVGRSVACLVRLNGRACREVVARQHGQA